MTENERMAALGETLKRISNELNEAAREFSLIGWDGHVSQVFGASNLLGIYAHQLKAKSGCGV